MAHFYRIDGEPTTLAGLLGEDRPEEERPSPEDCARIAAMLPGSAIEIGGGAFATCRVECYPGMDDPDWWILEINDKGPGHFYRFWIEGENVNALPGEYGRRFGWSVRSVADPRFAAHPNATPAVVAAVAAAKETR